MKTASFLAMKLFVMVMDSGQHNTLNNILVDCWRFRMPGDQHYSNSNNANEGAEDSNDASKIIG
jgi:hypothetical protein